MTEFLWAGEDRLLDILSLWKQGFPEDSEDDVRTFMYTLKEEARCLMLLKDNEACSMAFVIPAKMGGSTVWYVYAAVTAEAFRGQGCFASLLDELARRAETQNVHGLFLRPATPSLFSYYARLGFVSLFYNTETCCEGNGLYAENADWQWERVATCDVAAQRDGWLTRLGVPFVSWSQAATVYAVSLLEGGGALASDKGFIMYCRDGDGIEITELLCAAEDTCDALSSLSRHFACQIKHCCCPPATAKNTKAYGMFRAINTSDKMHGEWYMGFSLE